MVLRHSTLRFFTSTALPLSSAYPIKIWDFSGDNPREDGYPDFFSFNHYDFIGLMKKTMNSIGKCYLMKGHTLQSHCLEKF